MYVAEPTSTVFLIDHEDDDRSLEECVLQVKYPTVGAYQEKRRKFYRCCVLVLYRVENLRDGQGVLCVHIRSPSSHPPANTN